MQHWACPRDNGQPPGPRIVILGKDDYWLVGKNGKVKSFPVAETKDPQIIKNVLAFFLNTSPRQKKIMVEENK